MELEKHKMRKTQPLKKQIGVIELTTPKMFLLDNGIPVYLLNTGSQELVKIEFLFDAGVYFQNKKLQASFTNKMLSEGTKSHSSYEISQTFDNLGAFINTYTDKDHASISVYILNKHIPSILPIVSEIISEPTFPEDEFEILKKKSKQEFKINLEKVKFIAGINFTNLLYGDKNPYGWKSNESDFENIQVSDLNTFHSDYYSLNNCKIIVSGNIEEKFKKQLNDHIGSLMVNSNALIKRPNFQFNESEEKHQKINKDNALQSAIRIGKVLFNKTHEDFIRMQILNTILGGYFGSRLMSNIREDKGYTYGIGSSLISLKESGYFSISTEVGTEFLIPSLDEIYKEIDRLRMNKIDIKELELVKNYILGTLIRGLDGPFALHEKFKSVLVHGYGIDYFEKFIKNIKTTSQSHILELANKYLKKNTFVELVVGK